MCTANWRASSFTFRSKPCCSTCLHTSCAMSPRFTGRCATETDRFSNTLLIKVCSTFILKWRIASDKMEAVYSFDMQVKILVIWHLPGVKFHIQEYCFYLRNTATIRMHFIRPYNIDGPYLASAQPKKWRFWSIFNFCVIAWYISISSGPYVFDHGDHFFGIKKTRK